MFIDCLSCIFVILLNKFNSIQFNRGKLHRVRMVAILCETIRTFLSSMHAELLPWSHYYIFPYLSPDNQICCGQHSLAPICSHLCMPLVILLSFLPCLYRYILSIHLNIIIPLLSGKCFSASVDANLSHQYISFDTIVATICE